MTNPLQDRVNELESLAVAMFPNLTAAEIKLLNTVPDGSMTDCKSGTPLTTATESTGTAQSADTNVRAALLRWLCTDARAATLVDPLGIQLWNATVTDSLDLSFVRVQFPLAFINCQIMGDIILRAAEVPDLNLTLTEVRGIEASSAQIKGGVFLRSGFRSHGEVRLLGARIGGDLDCSKGMFLNPCLPGVPGGGVALSGDRAEIGRVFLNKGFHAEGEVRFPGAKIDGDFSCAGGEFHNSVSGDGFHGYGSGRSALNLEGMTVEDNVLMDEGFSPHGEVRILGAHIRGNLDCSNSNFANQSKGRGPEAGAALAADGASIGGTLFLRGADVDGDVGLLGAHIQKNLECIDSKFKGHVALRGACVRGGLHWLGIRDPELARLSLDDASASRVLDDEGSWPSKGNLDIDGFTYERIAQGPRNHVKRLEWLDRQADFVPQPYRHLAMVLKNEGDGDGARRVLCEMEHRARSRAGKHLSATAWDAALRWTIGYGYFPGRALLWLACLVLVGTALFWVGYATGSITPTEEGAYVAFKSRGALPAGHERFHALVYSAENAFPLVRLGQVDQWQPDPSPGQSSWRIESWHGRQLWITWSGFLRWFRWAEILLGWTLATLFVAGVTGVVRRD